MPSLQDLDSRVLQSDLFAAFPKLDKFTFRTGTFPFKENLECFIESSWYRVQGPQEHCIFAQSGMLHL